MSFTFSILGCVDHLRHSNWSLRSQQSILEFIICTDDDCSMVELRVIGVVACSGIERRQVGSWDYSAEN